MPVFYPPLSFCKQHINVRVVLLTSINASGQAKMIPDTANRVPLRFTLCFHSPCQLGGPLRFYSLQARSSVQASAWGWGEHWGEGQGVLPAFPVWEGVSSAQRAAPMQPGRMVTGKKPGERVKVQSYFSASYSVPASRSCWLQG